MQLVEDGREVYGITPLKRRVLNRKVPEGKCNGFFQRRVFYLMGEHAFLVLNSGLGHLEMDGRYLFHNL